MRKLNFLVPFVLAAFLASCTLPINPGGGGGNGGGGNGGGGGRGGGGTGRTGGTGGRTGGSGGQTGKTGGTGGQTGKTGSTGTTGSTGVTGGTGGGTGNIDTTKKGTLFGHVDINNTRVGPNGDTLAGSGVTPGAGVVVTITGPNGFTVTVVTDANGNFSIDLPPGVYVVTIQPQAGSTAAPPQKVQITSGGTVRLLFTNQGGK